MSDSLPVQLRERNTRSCIECSRRKVRCDRQSPCNNCVRAETECVFPKFRKRPLKRQKARAEDEQRSSVSLPPNEGQMVTGDSTSEGPTAIVTPNSSQDGFQHVKRSSVASSGLYDQIADRREEPTWLVRQQNKSRCSYTHGQQDISNNFWASMTREVEEMRDVLDGSSPESDAEDGDTSTRQDADIPTTALRASRNSFLFNPLTGVPPLHIFYPTPSQLLTAFDVFQENVDPVAKIFHRSTLRSTVLDSLEHMEELHKDKAKVVVIFALFYAAITSVNSLDCERLFGDQQAPLLQRYRFAMEQALARARFLDTQNLDILAAVVLFLLCVRRHDTSRYVSSVLGVVLRNARSMGLHRDGTNFGLTPYETEMRRRIWWHICVLDLRSSEDHGYEPEIHDWSYDTKFPSNINDADISPNQVESPKERTSSTDMTFCLLRCEMTIAVRKLHYHDPLGKGTALSAMEKRQMVQSTDKHWHERYINQCDITKPVDWVSATWAKMMLAKMWLAVSNPLLFQDGTRNAIPLSSRRLAFDKAIVVLELANLLETSPRAARWQWLFLTHTQWHAVVFALAYLCQRPGDELNDRAWKAIDSVYDRWSYEGQEQRGMLWKPVRRLLEKARNARKEAVSQQQPSVEPPTTKAASDLQGNSTLQEGSDPTLAAESLTPWSDWTALVDDMQLDFGQVQSPSTIDMTQAMQGYMSSLWETL